KQIPSRPDLDTATFVLSQFPDPHKSESQIALIDAATNQRVTYARLHRSIRSLASGLYHSIGVRKGDVVFVLSPNSLLYPTISLAVFSVGAVLTTANPLNTKAEIAKQVRDSGAKLAISAPEELHKLVPTGVPTSDTAAILFSSGTTGTSKGVILTHANFIFLMTLLRRSVEVSSAEKDEFLCFIPMFHIYGLAFFALGLFCSRVTTLLMQKFELQVMLDAIQAHKISNIPAVPPVILGLVKYATKAGSDLSCLRRVGSGAAQLSKEVADRFGERFPWVELRQGYGLTGSSGAATFFASSREAKARSGSSGMLVPSFCAEVVDTETGKGLPPYREGELWLKSPTIMKGYLGNVEATTATIDSDGWLKTGDLCYFDEEGYLYVLDRIKELIKHNGMNGFNNELEAILLSHPTILDAAVIPLEDEEAGQIQIAYAVKAAGSELTEDQVIQFVADQFMDGYMGMAPYKKVTRVAFASAISRSAAGKILRKELISQRKQQLISKL
ncbi:hypothetical protein I3760_01G263500, partial [Carya illinoinensis]